MLCAAEESILRYLNREELPGCAQSLLIELAALKYLRTDSAGARKSASYTEGQLSQSELLHERRSVGRGGGAAAHAGPLTAGWRAGRDPDGSAGDTAGLAAGL